GGAGGLEGQPSSPASRARRGRCGERPGRAAIHPRWRLARRRRHGGASRPADAGADRSRDRELVSRARGSPHPGSRWRAGMARVSSATPIVALDVASAPEAMTIVDELGASCRFYKVGSELFTGVGPAIVAALRDRGCDVFLDLKLHDIPTTVAGAVRTAAALGARLVTVHATGGEAMLSAAVSSAGDQTKCGVLAVTVLTSLASRDVAGAWGRPDALDLSTEVQRLAAMVANVGAHGVVCSGRE